MSPIQKDEHSIHKSIFLKKEGARLATKFLTGVKMSDSDHMAVIPQETNRKDIKVLMFLLYYVFRLF